MSETPTKPNPGSDEALALGCTCPVLDNGRGRSRGDGLYWITAGCPLHAGEWRWTETHPSTETPAEAGKEQGT